LLYFTYLPRSPQWMDFGVTSFHGPPDPGVSDPGLSNPGLPDPGLSDSGPL